MLRVVKQGQNGQSLTMTQTLPRLRNSAARRLFMQRHGLSGPVADTTRGIIDDLGFVQLDSINTVARAHHMILHARKTSYREPEFNPLLAKKRAVFESWTHDASVISAQFYPQWRLKFERDPIKLRKHYKEWRREGFEEKCDVILQQIADQGPCSSSDVGTGEKRGSGGWWDWHPSKTALEFLWRSGQLAVCHRSGFRKFYDLTENVIPPEHLNARMEEEEIIDWACNAALDRLGFASSGELAAFWELISPAEAKAWCVAALAAGEIVEVEIEGVEKPFNGFMRPATLEDEYPEPPGLVRVLSPFDPMIRDRKRCERLFGFNYRIEVFVPEAKRIYGYYVFPVLEGGKMIGRVDAKCDRKTGRLNVRAFWPEPKVVMGPQRVKKLEVALGRTARFAGTPEVVFDQDWMR
jgi:uncharacterized protein YcaQ